MDYILKGMRLDKNDLNKLRIDTCPKCQHPTLQARLVDSFKYTCLNCGSVLAMATVVEA